MRESDPTVMLGLVTVAVLLALMVTCATLLAWWLL
jgi:hypothetical protein